MQPFGGSSSNRYYYKVHVKEEAETWRIRLLFVRCVSEKSSENMIVGIAYGNLHKAVL